MMERATLNKAIEIDSKISSIGNILNILNKIEEIKDKKISIVRLIVWEGARNQSYDLDFEKLQPLINSELESLKRGLVLNKGSLEIDLKNLQDEDRQTKMGESKE